MLTYDPETDDRYYDDPPTNANTRDFAGTVTFGGGNFRYVGEFDGDYVVHELYFERDTVQLFNLADIACDALINECCQDMWEERRS